MQRSRVIDSGAADLLRDVRAFIDEVEEEGEIAYFSLLPVPGTGKLLAVADTKP